MNISIQTVDICVRTGIFSVATGRCAFAGGAERRGVFIQIRQAGLSGEFVTDRPACFADNVESGMTASPCEGVFPL